MSQFILFSCILLHLTLKFTYATATNSSNYDIQSSYIQSKTYQRQIRNRAKSRIKSKSTSSFSQSLEHKIITEHFATHRIDSFKACPAYQEGLSDSRPRNKNYDIKNGHLGSTSITQLLMHQSYLSIELDGSVGGVKGWKSGTTTRIYTTRIKYRNNYYDVLQSVHNKRFLCMKRNGRVYTVKDGKFRLPACLWNIHVNYDNMRTIYNHNCCSQNVQVKNHKKEVLRVVNQVSNKPDRLRRHRENNNNKPVNPVVFETRRLYDKERTNFKKNKKSKNKNKRRNRKQRIRENQRKNKKKGRKKGTLKIPTMATPPPAQTHETWEYTLCKLQMDAKSHKIKNGKAKQATNDDNKGSRTSRSKLRRKLDPGWFFQK